MGSVSLRLDDKPRNVPFDLDATGRWHDSYDIALPAGYVVDETPDPVDVDMDFASYHRQQQPKDNTLHYETRLHRAPGGDSCGPCRAIFVNSKRNPLRRKGHCGTEEAVGGPRAGGAAFVIPALQRGESELQEFSRSLVGAAQGCYSRDLWPCRSPLGSILLD